MALPIVVSGGVSRPTSPNAAYSSTIDTHRCAQLTLAAETLEVSPGFRSADLGTPRQIGAAMALMERVVTIDLADLGETVRSAVAPFETYIDLGYLPESPPEVPMFARVRTLHSLDSEQSRESRMHSVLQAGLEALEPVADVGINLLNIVGRTGTIVVSAIVLRQIVAFHVERALREGDSPEATREWLAAALAMTGPALILFGAIRNELAGMANQASNLGRICMASITLGAFIMSHLCGASKTQVPVMTAATIYVLVRGLANAFFPLPDNAGPANTRATGLTTAVYGMAQFILAEVGQMMPSSGAARSALGLGYDLFADMINGALSAVGIIVDDCTSIFFKSWPVISPPRALDSVFSDPESLQQEALQVRVGFQIPSRSQLADAMFNVGALRLSASHAITMAVGAMVQWLEDSDVGDDKQSLILNGCLAMMLMLIYFPLVFGSATRTDNTYALQETYVP